MGRREQEWPRGAYLVEALDGEGEELGYVGLVGCSREREHGGGVHVGAGGGEF
jgi:hypothetical protein